MELSSVVVLGSLLLFNGLFYLWWLDRGLRSVPPAVAKLRRKRWTDKEMKAMYRKVQNNPTDVRPFIFPQRHRRYVIVGGSGLVGSWIVNHLLQRGENPTAMRILDLQEPTRPEVAKNKIRWIKTDVADPETVEAGFAATWDSEVAKLPLTVFHTAAYIQAGYRAPDYLERFERINVKGTEHVLASAQTAGADCFVATSSCSVGIRLVRFFSPPWKSVPDNFVQITENCDPLVPDGGLENFAGCYAYSKFLSERKVMAADRPGFRTGVLRPGNAIYGAGIAHVSSFLYDVLRRGDVPSWFGHMVTSHACAQNVSIAHLAFENTLLNDPQSPMGGHAYHCSDPGTPVAYGELYHALMTLSHPGRPIRIRSIPLVPILLVCYILETYQILQQRYLSFLLPPMTGDAAQMTPGMLQLNTGHVIFDQTKTFRDIGYRPPIDTLEGICDQVLFFNRLVDAGLFK